MDTDTRARARANLSSMWSAYNVRIIRSNIFSEGNVLFRAECGARDQYVFIQGSSLPGQSKASGERYYDSVGSGKASKSTSINIEPPAHAAVIPGQCRHGIVSDTGPEEHSIRSD
jgi:hypothetical protein